MTKNKKILLLGGSSQQIIAIEKAKKMGLYTIVCDYLPDNPGQHYADSFYLVSTTDKDAILEVARKEKIEGILAYASDPAAPTAAYVAERLGLPGESAKSVDILCNKKKFRDFLKENGFCTPDTNSFIDISTALSQKEIFEYPLIIKPVDSSGSKGVKVLFNESGLEEALNTAFSFSRCHQVVVERFINRNHPFLVGGDILVVNGEVVLWGLLNCHRDERVNSLVPVGKSFPLMINEVALEKIKKTISRLIRLIGIKNCELNIELVMDKNENIYIIDMGPRCGGNMIPELLGDIYNLDLPKIAIKSAIGKPILVNVKSNSGYYATHNLHSSVDGILNGIIYDKMIANYIYRKIEYKQRGDKVEYFDNAAKCLGIVFMRFPDIVEMNNVLEHVNDHIKVSLANMANGM